MLQNWLTAAPALAQRGPGGYGGMPGPYMMWGGGWFGSIFMWIFWILLLVLLGLAVRRLWSGPSGPAGGSGGPGAGGDSALEILRRRYAAGEIGKDEFESMKRDLQA